MVILLGSDRFGIGLSGRSGMRFHLQELAQASASHCRNQPESTQSAMGEVSTELPERGKVPLGCVSHPGREEICSRFCSAAVGVFI
jgi:hypothetical protein